MHELKMFLNEITRLNTTKEKISKYVDTTIETTKKKKKYCYVQIGKGLKEV